MTDLSEAELAKTPGSDAATGAPRSATPSLLKLGLRIALGLFVLIAGVALLGKAFRPELEALGRGFVDNFGLWGMTLGSLLADGFHFPIPPQFYMLLGISSGVPTLQTLGAVNVGSFIGGWTAYLLATRLGELGLIQRWLEQPRRLTDAVFARYGNWSVVVASFLPITYSALCYMSGLGRVPRWGFFLITLIRIPRLVAYYYVVKLGWKFV